MSVELSRQATVVILLALVPSFVACSAADHRQGPVEYELVLKPYIQLGNAELGSATDQLVITWQALVVPAESRSQDTFTLDYRQANQSKWTSVDLEPPITVGSPQRQNHYAVLTGLRFDEEYEYRVTHLRNGEPIPGAIYQENVHTRKTKGAFRFTVSSATGNRILGRQEDRDMIAPFLLSQNIDFHLLLGDIVYQRGEYENFRSRFFDTYDPLMATKLFFYTVGNHESATQRARPALEHFFLPANGPSSRDPERFYSFDYGNAHFVAVDTAETMRFLQRSNSDITRWLEADLAASDKTWKILFAHETPLAMDPCGTDREGYAEVRDAILKTAVEHGVDLFLGGSTHSYQRYLPITQVHSPPPAANPFSGTLDKASDAIRIVRRGLSARVSNRIGRDREPGKPNVAVHDPIDDPSELVEWSPEPTGKGTTLIYSGNTEWVREATCESASDLVAPLVQYKVQIGYTVIDVDAESMTVRMMAQDGRSVIDSVTLRKQ